jgi:hypothetical protein
VGKPLDGRADRRLHRGADSCAQLIRFSEFYYQLSVDGLANGSDAFGG